MTHDVRDEEEALGAELAARFTLDAGAGPAPRVSTQRATELVRGALDAKAATGAGAQPARLRGGRIARTVFAVGAGLALAGAAAAMVARLDAPGAAEPATAPVHGGSERPAPNTDAPADDAPAAVATAPGEDLLQHANRLRADADFVGAERLYTRVVAEHPGSLAAYVARVAAASIRLEHLGDADGARALLLDAAREQPNGALDPEIRTGLAKAERARGDRDGERRALDALLSKHADGPAADRARERLEALDRER